MKSEELEKLINETPLMKRVRVTIPGIMLYEGQFVFVREGSIHIIDDNGRKAIIPRNLIEKWEIL